MTDISIQKLNSENLESAKQLCQVFGLFQREAGVAEPPLPSETHLLELLKRNDFHAVAAFVDGIVVGGLTAYEMTMFQFEATELFIYDVAVEAAHRRTGVGKALLEFTKSLCETRGIRTCYVGAMAGDNEALRLYESAGLQRETIAWFVREFEK